MKPNLTLPIMFLSRLFRLGEEDAPPDEPVQGSPAPALLLESGMPPKDAQGRPILCPVTIIQGTIPGTRKPSMDILISAGAILRVPRVSLGNRSLVERLQAIEELALQAETLVREDGPDRDLVAAIEAERKSTDLGQAILREILPAEACDLIAQDEAMHIVGALKSGPASLPDEMRPDFTAPDPAGDASGEAK